MHLLQHTIKALSQGIAATVVYLIENRTVIFAVNVGFDYSDDLSLDLIVIAVVKVAVSQLTLGSAGSPCRENRLYSAATKGSK